MKKITITFKICSSIKSVFESIKKYVSKINEINKLRFNLITCQLNNFKEWVIEKITDIEHQIPDVSNDCLVLDKAKPGDAIIPVGLAEQPNTGCLKLTQITFPLTVTNRIIIRDQGTHVIPRNGNPGEYVPKTVTAVLVQLQGAGAGGGGWDSYMIGKDGEASFFSINGIDILKGEGGSKGYPALHPGVTPGDPPYEPSPEHGYGGYGRILDHSRINRAIIIDVPSGAGARDWVESTESGLGATGNGGRPIGPYGKAGLQTGHLPITDFPSKFPPEKIQASLDNVCGYMGGGAGGGSWFGCSWGGGGGAGGYAECLVNILPTDSLSCYLGKGGLSGNLNALPYDPRPPKGGDGYIILSW